MSLEGVRGSYFEAGLLKIAQNADGNDSFYSPLLRKFYPMTKTGHTQAILEASQLGINELNTLIGNITDPVQFAHLNEVRDLNDLFIKAQDAGSESYRLLQNLGIEDAAGKKMKVERFGYSRIQDFRAMEADAAGEIPMGLEGARQNVEQLQGDIYIDVRNQAGSKKNYG
jgi:hypothetical protein